MVLTLDLSKFDLSALDRDALLRDLDRADCEESLYAFLKAAWRWIDPSPFVEGWCIEAICEHLQAVVDGDIRRLIINVPPRCSKSSVCSVAFPAWVWAQRNDSPTSGPSVPMMYGSHALNLALRDSVKCRRLIESPWYQSRWGDRFKLEGDQNTKGRFTNSKKGERLITAVEAKVTGEGASLILIDDPSAANEVLSAAMIETTKEWWDGTMSTRLNDPNTGAFIVIQQRLAEDDLTGHILETDQGWTHLCYDDQTEVLTRRGWVNFAALTEQDDVMGVDPVSFVGTWERPTNYVRRQHDGEVIAYGSDVADLVVTPDHRMVYVDANDVADGNVYGRVRPAEKLPGTFYLPQTIKWHNDSGFVQFGGRQWTSRAFAEFMGWYLSEGCANAKSRATRIVQKIGGRYVPELERVLASVPFHVGKSKNNDRMWVWQIRDKGLAAALEPLGKSGNKAAPSVLKELGADDLAAFIGAYAKGDGHAAVRNARKVTISSTSGRMIDDLQECAAKCGWASSKSSSVSKGRPFNGYMMRDTLMYRLYIRASKAVGRTRKFGAQIHKRHASRRQYSGMVYCVSVPSTAVLVRRNGRVAVSGNCLPMHYEAERSFVTSIGWKDPRTEEGELLWPERFDAEAVRNLERRLGPFRASGQLEQRPEPKGGGIIKRDWWRLYQKLDAQGNPSPTLSYPPVELVIAALDTAYTEKEENDFSAMTTWGVFSGAEATGANRYATHAGGVAEAADQAASFTTAVNEAPAVMMMHAWQARLELHDLVTKVAKTCVDLRVDRLLIEDKAAGHSVAQELRRLYANAGFAVQLVPPTGGDKVARLYSVQHLFAEGLIWAPDKTWAEMVISQVATFPKGKHDDLVDTVSMALQYLRRVGILVRAPEWAHDVAESMRHRPQERPLYEV